jgi:lipoprotein-anchoring transpeptidase ErfK/SrfK
VLAAAVLAGLAAGVSPAGAAHRHANGLPTGYTRLATPRGVIAGYASPGGRETRLVRPRWHDEPLTMPVRKVRRGYDDVRLPGRPNGATVWVKATDVISTATPYFILVNLKTTHLKLVYKGHRVMNAPVGVGTSADPTPKGRFFVAFYAEAPNPGYGPFVMVTSAHSSTITDWEQSGDAMVAIHGPLGAGAQIGTSGAHVSHGCIRLHVRDQRRLARVPVGTPVVVVN